VILTEFNEEYVASLLSKITPTSDFDCMLFSFFKHSAYETATIFTRDSICAITRICHGNSVCPSVTRVDQSKAFEVRIMQFSPYSSPIPLVSAG